MAGLYEELMNRPGPQQSGLWDQLMAQDRPPANLSLIERGFLGAMSLADRVGAGSTSLKLYNDVIQNGRTSPITERDFSPTEIDAIRSMVSDHSTKNSRTAGHIDYRDYPGGNLMMANRSKESGEIMNTLGGFDYSIDPAGSMKVTDKYDFNADRGGALDNSLWAQGLSVILNPRNLAASIGRKILPDTSGRGVPVAITIPTK